jgi:hypothetical protein
VSAAAYSADRRFAVLAVSVAWGGLDGEGHYVVVQRLPAGWVVIASQPSWFS